MLDDEYANHSRSFETDLFIFVSSCKYIVADSNLQMLSSFHVNIYETPIQTGLSQ